MIPTGQDSLRTRSTVEVAGKSYTYFSIPKAADALGDVSRLPFSMKVLLENLLRFEDGQTVTRDDLQAMVDWQKERRIAPEIHHLCPSSTYSSPSQPTLSWMLVASELATSCSLIHSGDENR